MTIMFLQLLTVLTLFTLTQCGVASMDINPLIASEDENGIPYLQGENHTQADGGFFNAGRNIAVALWVLNDSTWGAAGLAGETATVIRATWTQQVVVSQVLAATKKGGMLDRFRKDDGTYGVPDYKLSNEDLDCLYSDPSELDRFRATAAVTAMKGWLDYSYPEKLWGSDTYTSRAVFYEQLKCNGEDCRTHPFFHMFELVDSFTIDTEIEDNDSFCTSVSPQSIGWKVAMQINEYACNDGWNQCGADGPGYGSYGMQAYVDTTGYYPVNGPHNKNKRNKHRWAPIQETDGRGYFTRQEFVVPHIGATADTVYLSAEDREQLREEYMMESVGDYEQLARESLERTAMFANNETYKTLIAWFDDKLNLAAETTAQLMFNPTLNWKLEDVAYYLQGYIMLEYDGIIVNWRSKVENDHVRPTTVVQEYLAGEIITNWMKGSNETSTYRAELWTPYIRVMPHAEYPSGSACICTTVMKWSAQALRVDYDEDFPITYNHPAGSNRFEPSLPTQDFSQTYRSFKDVADVCAQSRVDGGMHFPEAIVAGDAMCGGDLVYEKGVAFQKFIWTGNDAFLEPWGGINSFGHVASKNCQYSPNANSKKGKSRRRAEKRKKGGKSVPSKFVCD